MSRDELARNLYIGIPLTKDVLNARAAEWDKDQVSISDRADCYARADQLIREGKVPS